MYVCMYVCTNEIERISFTNGTIGAMRFMSFCMIRQKRDGFKAHKALIEISCFDIHLYLHMYVCICVYMYV